MQHKTKLFALLVLITTFHAAAAEEQEQLRRACQNTLPRNGITWLALVSSNQGVVFAVSWAAGWLDANQKKNFYAGNPVRLVVELTQFYVNDRGNLPVKMEDAALFVAEYHGMTPDAAALRVEHLRRDASAAH
jgi:hypothetical protein